MVFDFIIKETKKTTVPVRAKNYRTAQTIFDTWYNSHINNPKDTTIYDMLDEGSSGIEIVRCAGKDEHLYNPEDILLPEEQPVPQEPKYDLYIKLADEGDKVLKYYNLTLGQVGSELQYYSVRHYLFPDNALYPIKQRDDGRNPIMWIRAVLKK